MSDEEIAKKPKSSAKARRTASRLAAVQVLYELEMGDRATARQAMYDVLSMPQNEFTETLVAPDPSFLNMIVIGLAARLRDVDALLNGAMGESGRSLDQTETTLRCILRAGAFELLSDETTPSAIILNDYINIAHAFFTGPEPKKVNGVLDRVAKNLDR